MKGRERTTSEGAPATQHAPKRLDDSCSMGNGLSAVSRNLFLPVRARSPKSQVPGPNGHSDPWDYQVHAYLTRGC